MRDKVIMLGEVIMLDKVIMPTRSSRWSRASRSFRRMLQRGNGSWKTSAIWLAELQTLPECSCVPAEALEERRLAKRALTGLA